jgi:quercetin dioxygenase-like cupin family protein
MKLRLLALTAATMAVLIAGAVPMHAQGTCPPLTQGYWKNHQGAWLDGSGLMLGTNFYTNAQLETILQTPACGDVSVSLSGDQTNGRFCVIDMYVPPGGGPGPHRHDFEETFILLEGEVEATFRGKKSIVKAGDTINILSNAPHQFHNSSSSAARLLCICSPAGSENFFMELGVKVATRTTSPPKLSPDEQAAFTKKAKEIMPRYRTEPLKEA